MRDPRISEKCAVSGHPSHRVVIYVMVNGAEHFCAWCFLCDRNVTRDVDRAQRSYYPRAFILDALAKQGMQLGEMLRVRPDGGFRVCYACGTATTCEDDHVAERTIHGLLADRLPIVPLCRACHDLKTSNLQRFMERMRQTAA